MDLAMLSDDRAHAGVEVTDLAYASGDVRSGTLFFCVRGFTADGHDYASEAVDRGAVALVCERSLGLGVPELLVGDVRQAMPTLAGKFFEHPNRELDVCGITGTNGKTTIAYLIRQLNELCERPTGMIGTVEWIVGGKATAAVRTTPEAIDVQRCLRAMATAGDLACAIEISSHALDLDRAEAIDFAATVFTNLTQDHLDFHTTMDDYFAAKRKLFEAPARVRVSNIDDPYGARLAAEFECLTYSAAGKPADFVARDMQFDASGTRFTCVVADQQVPVSLTLPGAYNVSNALAALAVVSALGMPLKVAAANLAQCQGAPGRFERVVAGQSFQVVVDYAHTPDSVDNVLATAAALPHNRLIAVLGAGGDRDRSKRPLMGEAAARHCDVVFVTSDNPRSEDPRSIVDQVAAGATAAGRESGAEINIEVDRRIAIELACAEAGPGDIVVIAGKGHEQGQEFAGGQKIPFDDATVAREALAKAAAAQ